MINSNVRKLCLSGWLHENYTAVYSVPLRLQKYLFFYESFSKIEENIADFDNLKGYKRGPVFSTVWGDYTKEHNEFNVIASKMLDRYPDFINLQRAKRAAFIVSSISEKELSVLTHKYHIWNAKSERIMSGEQQVDLNESDFNTNDYKITESLVNMYPNDLICNSTIVTVGETYFVFSNEDMSKLSEQHMDTMEAVAETPDLYNPVYVRIDENGGLIID